MGGLSDIIKSTNDSDREITQQIGCQEIGDQRNDQGLTSITSSNLKQNVEGAEECTISENVQISTSLAHSEPESSTKSINQIMPGSEIPAVMPTSSLPPQSVSKPLTSNPIDISLPKTPHDETELVNTISTSQLDLKDQQQSLEKIGITKNEIPHEIKVMQTSFIYMEQLILPFFFFWVMQIIRDLEVQSAQKETVSRENVGDKIQLSTNSFKYCKTHRS
ncbi:uncharacterized protein LOC114717785 [Neltuma alba]|uniref:uncharacterized protein LOC114717785 n=1 Tax=Neltuma alba TaxID=207710 RepID=UPI0010A39888|nr:uncharacterized protein LOC114717785 [Prosopis alba]